MSTANTDVNGLRSPLLPDSHSSGGRGSNESLQSTDSDSDPRTNGMFLVRTCFFSRKLEMFFDYTLVVLGIWSLMQASAACRASHPPLFSWMVGATALRAVDALNYSWIMWIKPRMDPRRRRPLRYGSVLLRAFTLFGSSALIAVPNLWGSIPIGTNGEPVPLACGSVFSVTMTINYWVSFFQTTILFLFGVMLSCYGVLYCRRRRRCGCVDIEADRYPGSISTNITEHPHPLASHDALRSITEVITFDSLQDARDEIECCICWEEFKADDELRSLPCHHFFHLRCVDPWLSERAGTCPVCRSSVVSS